MLDWKVRFCCIFHPYLAVRLTKRLLATVILQSSNNVQYEIKMINLRTCAEELAKTAAIPGGVESLSEDSSILDCLFKFLGGQQPPNLDDIVFSILLPLAEAAEKYQVHSAITICQLKFR